MTTDREWLELSERIKAETPNVFGGYMKFIGNFARAVLASQAIDGLSAGQEPWQTGTPPTKAGDYAEYIVAVRRQAVPDRVFVFSSNHANNYGADDLRNQDGDEYVADGWYTVGHDTSGEYDSLFMPMLEDGDEVLGWQPLPKWDAAPPSQAEKRGAFKQGYKEGYDEGTFDEAQRQAESRGEELLDKLRKLEAAARTMHETTQDFYAALKQSGSRDE